MVFDQLEVKRKSKKMMRDTKRVRVADTQIKCCLSWIKKDKTEAKYGFINHISRQRVKSMLSWITDGAKPEDFHLCNAATSQYRTDRCVCYGGWMPLQYNCPHTALAASAGGLPAVKSRNYSVGLVFPNQYLLPTYRPM